MVEVEPAEFLISAIKTTEDDRSFVVRGYNLSGHEISVRMKPWRTFTRVERVNLAEERLAIIQPSQDGNFKIKVHEHEIITVLFGDW